MSESKIVLTIDDELKNEAEDLFYSLGLNLETAISMFLTKAINEGGIPFEVKQNTLKVLILSLVTSLLNRLYMRLMNTLKIDLTKNLHFI